MAQALASLYSRKVSSALSGVSAAHSSCPTDAEADAGTHSDIKGDRWIMGLNPCLQGHQVYVSGPALQGDVNCHAAASRPDSKVLPNQPLLLVVDAVARKVLD